MGHFTANALLSLREDACGTVPIEIPGWIPGNAGGTLEERLSAGFAVCGPRSVETEASVGSGHVFRSDACKDLSGDADEIYGHAL